MVHNGNFHPILLALGFDALRAAIAHAGQLSERRMSHLWDAFFEHAGGLGSGPPEGTGPELFGLSLRYPAAAAVAELKQLAAPATLDVPPMDQGVEDHATGAPLSVGKTAAALDLLSDILAVELLLARDVLATMAARPALGTGTSAALRVVEDATAATPLPRAAAAVHRSLRARFPRTVGAHLPERGTTRPDS
jgi:histidine ammonia-lyase